MSVKSKYYILNPDTPADVYTVKRIVDNKIIGYWTKSFSNSINLQWWYTRFVHTDYPHTGTEPCTDEQFQLILKYGENAAHVLHNL